MQTNTTRILTLSLAATLALTSSSGLGAQASQTAKPPASASTSTPGKPTTTAGKAPANTAPALPVVPADYTIGPNDVLSILVWRDETLSGDVVVRPDGKITMRLLNDVQASGLKPETLGTNIAKALEAGNFKEGPSVTVVVKAINSRVVFINGQVGKTGAYPMTDHMTVANLIAIAGGIADFANKEDITLLHADGTSQRINYKDIERRKNLKQNNVELKAGDQLIVR